MAFKNVSITYKGVDYNLTYTRRSVKKMEDEGFDVTELEKKMVTRLPQMFHGAFKANHPFLKAEFIDEMYDHIKDRQGLLQVLGEMYADVLNSYTAEPEESEGNVGWSVR